MELFFSGEAFETEALQRIRVDIRREVNVQSLPVKFQLIVNMQEEQRLYPDDKDCSSEEHQVCGPELQGREWPGSQGDLMFQTPRCWSVSSGIAVGDTLIAAEPRRCREGSNSN